MTRRKKILFALLSASVALLVALEFSDHFYGLLLFAQPAVPHSSSAMCERLVVYKPFWREKVYAVNLSEAHDWLNYYYAGDQNWLEKMVQVCSDVHAQRYRSLYY